MIICVGVVTFAGQWPPLEFVVVLSCRSSPQAAVLARTAPCLAHARLVDPHWVLFQGLGDLFQLRRGGVGPGTGDQSGFQKFLDVPTWEEAGCSVVWNVAI